jgi:hypothetical protein
MGGISLAAQHLDAALEHAVRTNPAFPGPEEARALVRTAA